MYIEPTPWLNVHVFIAVLNLYKPIKGLFGLIPHDQRGWARREQGEGRTGAGEGEGVCMGSWSPIPIEQVYQQDEGR